MHCPYTHEYRAILWSVVNFPGTTSLMKGNSSLLQRPSAVRNASVRSGVPESRPIPCKNIGCLGLVQQATISSVGSRAQWFHYVQKTMFCFVFPQPLALRIFLSFEMVPELWEHGILQWFQLWMSTPEARTVVNLCVCHYHCMKTSLPLSLDEEINLIRSEACPALWVERHTFRGQSDTTYV